MNRFDRLPDNLKGIVFLMLASFVFAVMALLIKLLGQQLHITQILLVRQIGMVIMVAPAMLRNFPAALHSERPGLQLMRICCALVAMLCGFTAVIHMPLAEATAIFHKYRIDELPVVDADNKPVGMIDVQDIVTIKVVG